MDDNIGFLLNDTARLFRRAFNARVRDCGITALQWRMLMYLRRYEGIRQAPLAELIEVEPITLSRMVDRLVEAGLVERRADPADRRAWQLFLTSGASPLLDGVKQTTNALIDEASDGMTADEIKTLIELVARMRGNLSRRELI